MQGIREIALHFLLVSLCSRLLASYNYGVANKFNI